MTETQTVTCEGKVKWFSDQKGYGFIEREDNTDVFVHHTAIAMDGFRTLRQGEDVGYELLDGSKGPQAVRVWRLNGNGIVSENGPANGSVELNGVNGH